MRAAVIIGGSRLKDKNVTVVCSRCCIGSAKFAMSAHSCSRLLDQCVRLFRAGKEFALGLCVLHSLFSPLAALGNLLVIYALWKASSIPANAKKMFLSLAFSDIAVGMLSQPAGSTIFAVMFKMSSTDDYRSFESFCPTILPTFYFLIALLGFATFLNTTAIAVDRLLSILLHLRYQELVTSKRVIIALASLWLTSAVSACIYISHPGGNDVATAILLFVGLVLTTAAYVYICKVVRHHRNQISSQHQIQNGQAEELLRQKKVAYNAFFAFVVFLVCYLPYCASKIVFITNDSLQNIKAKVSLLFLVMLNSTLNPLIFCWRYREIRRIIKRTLRKLLCMNGEDA